MNKLKNTKKSAAFDRSSLIINLFREFPNNKFSLKHLASASGGATKEGRLRTREIITELLAQGTIEECGQEKYRLSGKERPRQEGIVQMISTGAMYIRSEEFENDVYVSQRNSLNALDGDRVEFVITRRSHAGSLEGEITRIVDATPLISDLQKQFYKTMLQTRKKRILDFSMEKLRKREKAKELEAR